MVRTVICIGCCNLHDRFILNLVSLIDRGIGMLFFKSPDVFLRFPHCHEFPRLIAPIEPAVTFHVYPGEVFNRGIHTDRAREIIECVWSGKTDIIKRWFGYYLLSLVNVFSENERHTGM